MKFITITTVKHNKELFQPGVEIELSEGQAKKLGGAVISKKEHDLKTAPGKAVTDIKVLNMENGKLKKEIEKLKGTITSVNAALEEAKKGGN